MDKNIEKLQIIIDGIETLDKNSIIEADKRMNSLAKPLKSLGKLEDMSIKISGITGSVKNELKKKAVIIMCSDNGVVDEGVASAPQSVTIAQTINFTKGLTGVAVLAQANNSDLIIVDVGINCDFSHPNVVDRKIRKATNNIAKGHAMTREECIKAIITGIDSVKEAKEKGYDIIGIGEMGIGNTSTSSAILCSITDLQVEEVVGRGAGLTDEAYLKKIDVVKKSIDINNPNRNDIIDVISKVGGFDIAAMTGAFLGAAYYKIPVVIDGFISVVAALCSYRLNKICREYMFTSHNSKEIGFKVAMKELNLSPILDLQMGLGEGSGCPLAFSIIDSACAIMNNMATFKEAEIDDSYLDEIRLLKNKGV